MEDLGYGRYIRSIWFASDCFRLVCPDDFVRLYLRTRKISAQPLRNYFFLYINAGN
jgi:hypothetical protein